MKEIGFKGRLAVITGAASGMGLYATKEFVRLGAKVIMCDVNAEALAGAAALIGPEAIPVAGDVRKYSYAEEVARVARENGGADYLIPFAGGFEARVCKSNVPFYEQPIEVIDWGIDVNLKGAVYFSRALMPQMVAKKYGVIVLVGSVTGFEGDGIGAMYGTAKSGLFNFVKGLAIAGAPHGVRAVCVTPGPVLTRPGMAGMPTLLGRAAELPELVDVILFMCSDNASFITGSNHVVDGGRLCMYQPVQPLKQQ
ncbi:MAG: SDR family oxidoreductase [Bacteroidales bacterium]|nr:SDR family oxidoreductase [Bacteroidales bacterium]